MTAEIGNEAGQVSFLGIFNSNSGCSARFTRENRYEQQIAGASYQTFDKLFFTARTDLKWPCFTAICPLLLLLLWLLLITLLLLGSAGLMLAEEMTIVVWLLPFPLMDDWMVQLLSPPLLSPPLLSTPLLPTESPSRGDTREMSL
jgi:hypothetical protein